MYKYLLLIILLINSSFISPQKVIQIKEELTIGEELSKQKELLFVRPDFIMTDSEGSIFIAESVEKTIRKFDKNGKYLFKFGRRGKGPGEFQDLTSVSINKGDTLIIIDQLLYRISFFSKECNYLNAAKINPEEMLWPRKIIQLNSGNYLLGFKLENSPDIFHIFNNNFDKKFTSFGSNAIDVHDNPYIDSASVEIFRGKIAGLENDDILYSPYIYDGNLYYYKKISDRKWKLVDRIKGYLKFKKPYIDINPNIKDYDPLDPPWSFKGYTGINSYAAILMNESRGLFILRNGNVINFTLIKNNENREFGFDLFDKKGNFLNHYVIYTKRLRKNMPTDIPIFVEWKDEEDNFYFKDLTTYPKIKKVKLIF